MKNFRRLCFAIVLTLAFTIPALAGDGHTPGAPDPGALDPGDSHTPGAPSPGDQHTPGFASSGIGQTPDSMDPGDMGSGGFAVMVAVIQSVLP